MPALKLLATGLFLMLMFRSGLLCYAERLDQRAWFKIADLSGLAAGLVLAVLVLGISLLPFLNSIAFPRYFFILLPSLVVFLSAWLASLRPQPGLGMVAVTGFAVLTLCVLGNHAFAIYSPAGGDKGMKGETNYRQMSLLAVEPVPRYLLSNRLEQARASDYVLINQGLLASGQQPWRSWPSAPDATAALPSSLLIADTGQSRAPMVSVLERLWRNGYRCTAPAGLFPWHEVQLCSRLRDTALAP